MNLCPYGENGIVWLVDIGAVDYVRAADVCCRTRVKRPRWNSGVLVGYSTLDASTASQHSGGFMRRVFWRVSHDRGAIGDTGVYRVGVPCEAVDPRTVAPGVWGTLTDRAWGAPLAARDPGKTHEQLVKRLVERACLDLEEWVVSLSEFAQPERRS